MLLHVSIICPFLLLSKISSCGCIIHLAIYGYRHLGCFLFLTSINNTDEYLCTNSSVVFPSLLGKYIQVELLSDMVNASSTL